MKRWRCKFHVWPYSQVVRSPAKYTIENEPNRGAKDPIVYVEAENFSDATRAARNVLAGILLDERVWNADIDALEIVDGE